MLPIAKFEPPFEDFLPRHRILILLKCGTYNLEHELITSWGAKQQLNPLPEKNSSLGVAANKS